MVALRSGLFTVSSEAGWVLTQQSRWLEWRIAVIHECWVKTQPTSLRELDRNGLAGLVYRHHDLPEGTRRRRRFSHWIKE